jgi:hypothetical protein
VKVITVRQPYADMIVNGRKNIEYRSWPTSYRGPVLIHAALHINRDLCRKFGRNPDALPRGGIVGIAKITDCIPDRLGAEYKFILQKRRPLPFTKWTGALGLREVPVRLLRRLSLRVLKSYKN